MAKLYFRYGTVGSAKTLNLLAVAHNYQQQNKKAIILQSAVDTRFGLGVVKSRAGLNRNADLLLHEDTQIEESHLRGVHCVLVDEAQFLAPTTIDQLRLIASQKGTPVICYGLRTDFRRQLFPGSKRLLELADSIEEVKTTCAFCTRKAVFNLKLSNGVATLQGPTVDFGTEEKYLPACAPCYENKISGVG